MGTFADNLRMAREAKGINKTQMAQALGLSLMAYVHYEKGDREPPLKKIKKISDILNISIDKLLDIEIDRFSHCKSLWNVLGYDVTELVKEDEDFVCIKSSKINSKERIISKDLFITFTSLGEVQSNAVAQEFFKLYMRGAIDKEYKLNNKFKFSIEMGDTNNN